MIPPEIQKQFEDAKRILGIEIDDAAFHEGLVPRVSFRVNGFAYQYMNYVYSFSACWALWRGEWSSVQSLSAYPNVVCNISDVGFTVALAKLIQEGTG